jgi:hypothetical protein
MYVCMCVTASDSYVERSKSLPGIVKAFRRVIQAYLPADQGQLLIDAAAAVADLHNECREYRLVWWCAGAYVYVWGVCMYGERTI